MWWCNNHGGQAFKVIRGQAVCGCLLAVPLLFCECFHDDSIINSRMELEMAIVSKFCRWERLHNVVHHLWLLHSHITNMGKSFTPVSICRERLRNTSNALTFRMFSEHIRLQVPPKLFGVSRWIVQMIRQ